MVLQIQLLHQLYYDHTNHVLWLHNPLNLQSFVAHHPHECPTLQHYVMYTQLVSINFQQPHFYGKSNSLATHLNAQVLVC